MPLVAGCSSSAGRPPATVTRVTPPTPTASGFGLGSLAAHLAYLRARSYTPDTRVVVPLQNGSRLYAIHSVCTGSADGHCQAVDAFIGSRATPILHREYAAVQSLTGLDNGFTVVARSYARGDPLCCPSGATVTDRYVWTGSALRESGPTPQPPSG